MVKMRRRTLRGFPDKTCEQKSGENKFWICFVTVSLPSSGKAENGVGVIDLGVLVFRLRLLLARQ
jgi:hypothetical protein